MNTNGFYKKALYFAYTNAHRNAINHFLYSPLRDSINSSYSPVYSNSWGYLGDKKRLAKEMEKQLRPISSDELGRLCQKIYDSADFASVCLSILESSSATLFQMACGYAVVLESLANIILPENEKILPINDKKIAANLRKELISTLNRVCPDLNDEARKPIQIRIENINQKTNMDSLKMPFEILGISLSNEDIKVLKTRNDFLHGRVPLINNQDHNNFDKVNKDIFYVTLRLYTLINMQILKYIGFSGRIVNYPKIHEKYTGMKLGEDYFRLI